MLPNLDRCADRIEASALAMDRLRALANNVRLGGIDVFTLYHYQRETERLLEGITSAIKLSGYQPAPRGQDV